MANAKSKKVQYSGLLVLLQNPAEYEISLCLAEILVLAEFCAPTYKAYLELQKED